MRVIWKGIQLFGKNGPRITAYYKTFNVVTLLFRSNDNEKGNVGTLVQLA